MKKQLLAAVLSAGMICLTPVQTLAAVDLNARYEISTNQISGWPAGPEITSDTGVLMDADTGFRKYRNETGRSHEHERLCVCSVYQVSQ